MVEAMRTLPISVNFEIVSVSPNLTEILYGLGAFDRVVAVSDYCTYPPAALSLSHIGGWSTPNLERIVSLHPDLVVMADAQAPILAYNLQQLHIRALVTPSQTVDNVFSAIHDIVLFSFNQLRVSGSLSRR
jgi:iron complex transport system substrate-binding protein